MNWVDALLDPRRFRWVPVSSGESGDVVYRREDGLVVAKAVPASRVAALQEERDRLVWLRDAGVACPQIVDWREADGGVCVVMTVVPGVPASELSGSDLLTAWPSIVRQLGVLHALPVEQCPFDRGFTTSDRVVCHGAPHMRNFQVEPRTLQCTGVVGLRRLGVADRYTDLALMLTSADQSWESAEQRRSAFDILFSTLGIAAPDYERLAAYRPALSANPVATEVNSPPPAIFSAPKRSANS